MIKFVCLLTEGAYFLTVIQNPFSFLLERMFRNVNIFGTFIPDKTVNTLYHEKIRK